MKIVVKNITVTMSESLCDQINLKYGSSKSATDGLSNCIWHGIDELVVVGDGDDLEVDEGEATFEDDIDTQIKNSVNAHINKTMGG